MNELEKIKFTKTKCEFCGKFRPTSLIRLKEVCTPCYNKLKDDNQKRINQGKEIPKDFSRIDDD